MKPAELFGWQAMSSEGSVRMAESDNARYSRFYKPDTRLGHREQSAMTADERAVVHGYTQQVSTTGILIMFVFLLLLAALLLMPADLAALLMSTDDRPLPDHERIWILDVAGVVLACWAIYGIVHIQYGVKARYWKTMPDQGLVDLESHTLVSAINLWSANIDYESCVVYEWVNGELTTVHYTGVSQWLLAKTTTGQWLILRHDMKGEMLKGKPEVPPVELHLQPTQNLALAFAPQTNICLGKRFSGKNLPVAQSGVWLREQEWLYLSKIANHYDFFYPQRHCLVSEEDGLWVDVLVERAQRNVPSVADMHAS
ncbi:MULTISPECIES: hypothetical protein [Pseudomonas syringae group]|uniref:hypothetical protein n=1 Tax=Pseudomonas syringae group TaxID=136849 RepID=UPI0012D8287F|nr:hypothetical protein [Pseudomonas syringae group genomosp. 3]